MMAIPTGIPTPGKPTHSKGVGVISTERYRSVDGFEAELTEPYAFSDTQTHT